MPDYGTKRDFIAITPEGIVAIRSGSKTDHTSAISASIPQVLAVTCSSNFNNRLTKLTTLNAYGIINLTSGSRNSNNNRLVLRYIDSSSRGIIDIIDEDGQIATKDLSFKGTGINDTIVNIPINSNDDSYLVAYRTVEALNKVPSFNSSFRAAIVDDGSSLSALTASIGNMTIGSGFKIRNSASLGTNSLTDGGEGKFTITSLNSGALALPDFSGTQVQVGGMMIGSSFKVGGSPDTFAYNIITSGSGKMNQRFYPGKLFLASASLVQRMDPDDKKSFEFIVPSQSIGGTDDLVPLYVSSSRRIGFATKDPLTDVDIRADEFQVQRTTERRGLRINTEGNIESFDKNSATAATGSEFILKYSRGITVNQEFINAIFGEGSVASDLEATNFFDSLKPDLQQSVLKKGETLGFISPPEVGDVLGSIRFVAESGSIGDFDERAAGETAAIRAVVSDGASDGVSADLIFSVANKSGTSQAKLLLDSNDNHLLTGSLDVFGNVILTGFLQAKGNSQTYIDFISSDNNIRFVNNNTQTFLLQTNKFQINPTKANVDFQVDGDTNDNLIFADAGTEKVGIGTNTSPEKLTVEGNISASGTIFASSLNVTSITSSIVTSSIIQTEGSNIFGDTIADTQTFNGHITASGNISASGNILGSTGSFDYLESDRIIGHTGDTGTGIQFGSDTTIINSNGVQVAKFRATAGTIIGSGNYPLSMSGTVIEVEGNITASGNISSSGTITADTLTSNNIVFTPGATSIKIEAPDESSGNVEGADLTIEAGNGFGSNVDGGNITLQTGKGSGAGDGGNLIIQSGGGGGPTQPSGSISLNSPLINVNGAITASGNISSSGTITALSSNIVTIDGGSF